MMSPVRKFFAVLLYSLRIVCCRFFIAQLFSIQYGNQALRSVQHFLQKNLPFTGFQTKDFSNSSQCPLWNSSLISIDNHRQSIVRKRTFSAQCIKSKCNNVMMKCLFIIGKRRVHSKKKFIYIVFHISTPFFLLFSMIFYRFI